MKSILAQCRDQLPKIALQVLTNGRAFSRSEIVDAWSGVKHPDLIAAIPVYSAVDHVHDHVVQAKGAFDETILGILKLKDRGQRVEVRVVLHALTAPLISETCRWLARNLPFVDHVALMGLENTGLPPGSKIVRSIAHKTTDRRELGPSVNCRYGMASCQRDDLVGMSKEKAVAAHLERVSPLLNKFCKGRLDLAWATCIHDPQAHPMGTRCSF